MSLRANPAPPETWSERVEYKRFERKDRLRGGARTVVWMLTWIDAPPDSSPATRATGWRIERRQSGVVFGARYLMTTFRPDVPVVMEPHGEWLFQWYALRITPPVDVETDHTQPIDEDAMRIVGLHDYHVLLAMLDRLRELEAAANARRRRTKR